MFTGLTTLFSKIIISSLWFSFSCLNATIIIVYGLWFLYFWGFYWIINTIIWKFFNSRYFCALEILSTVLWGTVEKHESYILSDATFEHPQYAFNKSYDFEVFNPSWWKFGFLFLEKSSLSFWLMLSLTLSVSTHKCVDNTQ